MSSRMREDVSELFLCFCEVAQPTAQKAAWIITTFPETYDDKAILDTLPKFVYPCEPSESSIVQHYSFVLTNGESKWTFGFVRHDPSTGTALVFLSFLPWHEVFLRMLNTASQLIRLCEAKELTDFLQFMMTHELPEPEKKLTLRLNPKLGTFECIMPASYQLPTIPENRNITEYYSAVGTSNMLVIFASMLYERRIVFKSRKLHRLSACVQAANTILYPMSWQHIFIPILPQHLADYLLAPMPFLIGVPSSIWDKVNKSDIGDIVLLDADTNTLETPHQDVLSLPIDVVKFLKTHLSSQSDVLHDGFARTFLKALVQLIGGYRDALKFQQGEKITFCAEAFVKSRPPSMQAFLRDMLQLQIFRQFIEERLDMLNEGLGFSDEFEFEACSYTVKSSVPSINDQYKDWKSTMKKQSTEIFNKVKNKANPVMKNAVESVRETGKDFKSACKGMKTRIKKDVNSHRRHHHRESPKFHAARPLTVGAPMSAPSTFKKPRVTSTVVSSRSNEYLPLGSSSEEATSPSNEESFSPPKLDMNLLGEFPAHFVRQCALADDSSPPVDRTLKPVRSSDGVALVTADEFSEHLPLSRSSQSFPFPSSYSPTNPFTFNFSKPSPFITDPFGFSSLPATTPYNPSNSVWNPFSVDPVSLPPSVLIPPPPSTTPTSHKKCNGTTDLIRLDSTSSQKEEPLSREDSTDSIAFKTGFTNPLYPYYSPNDSPKRLAQSLARPLSPTPTTYTPVYHKSTSLQGNTSFLHSSRLENSNNNLNKRDIDLLMEYGLDFETCSSNKSASNSAKDLDAFDMPLASKSMPQNAQSSWTKFE